jgi:hypothetical protein
MSPPQLQSETVSLVSLESPRNRALGWFWIFNDQLDSSSALIEAMHKCFGTGLTEVDQIMFEQQLAHHRSDADDKVVALCNDFAQFQESMRQRADVAMVERHEAKGEVVEKYFNNNGFRDMYYQWLTTQLYTEFCNEA